MLFTEIFFREINFSSEIDFTNLNFLMFFYFMIFLSLCYHYFTKQVNNHSCNDLMQLFAFRIPVKFIFKRS